QKLNVDDDEQFADLLARKIKQQLKSEMQTGKDPTLGYRVALAIVSVCVMVPLFIGLVIALALGVGAGSASIALGWGFVAACGVIFAVNAYFNWASTEIRKSELARARNENENENRDSKRE